MKEIPVYESFDGAEYTDYQKLTDYVMYEAQAAIDEQRWDIGEIFDMLPEKAEGGFDQQSMLSLSKQLLTGSTQAMGKQIRTEYQTADGSVFKNAQQAHEYEQGLVSDVLGDETVTLPKLVQLCDDPVTYQQLVNMAKIVLEKS